VLRLVDLIPIWCIIFTCQVDFVAILAHDVVLRLNFSGVEQMLHLVPKQDPVMCLAVQHTA
jgi:hypothetical protein